MKKMISKMPWIRIICILLLAYVNALAINGITVMKNSEYRYYGSGFYGWNPACILIFTVDCVLLNRFLRKEIWKDKGRWILSVALGCIFSLLAVAGMDLHYGSGELFGEGATPLRSLWLAAGLSFLVIPCISEITGFLNDHTLSVDAGSAKDSFFEKYPWIYFIFVWVITVLSFLPLFLYWWPGNFVYDADYQVASYMTKDLSTHHPILHTLLLGKAYSYGLSHGDANLGIMIYSLIQMTVLSSAFAFFMEYICQRKVKRSIRILLLCSFILNPINAWFAISTIKGVLSAAFLLIALTFLLRLLDDMDGITATKILNAAGFVLSGVLSCLFRNNMIYAVLAAGIVIALLQKGWKKKVFMAVVFIVFFAGNLGANKFLIRSTGAVENDTAKESMSVPLTCLARAAVYHRDRIGEENYREICRYIPEEALSEYTFAIADPIKDNANEKLLEENKMNFLKLVIKTGLKCPGDYIENIVGITAGYWFPLDYPYFLTGTTKLYDKYISNEYPTVVNKSILPFGNPVFDYLYGPEDGRLKLPLFGWAWRSSGYVWTYFFAVFYSIYRKNKRGIMLLLIPFMYMLTCFLGPVSWIRYIYINIATIPVVLYVLAGGKRD